MEPSVTVICAVYNHVNFIGEALEGFLRQKTTFPVEYVIHDDASTDGTTAVLKEYERNYPGFFTVIYEKENQHNKKVWPKFTEKAVLASESKYIALCEGDDYWCDEHKLQEQVDIMEKYESMTLCIHSGYILDNQSGEMRLVRAFRRTGPVSRRDIFIEPNGMVLTCSMLMRTSAMKEYPVGTFHSPVGDRNRRIFLAVKGETYYIDKPMGVYRTNIQHSFSARVLNREKSLEFVKKMNAFYDEFDAYTHYQFTNYIKASKAKEYLQHYLKFHEYKNIVSNEYFRKYYSPRKKLRIYIMWKMPGAYNCYSSIKKVLSRGKTRFGHNS